MKPTGVCYALLTYGFEMKSAGPRKKSEIPLMKYPLIMNFLVPCMTKDDPGVIIYVPKYRYTV